MEHPIYKWMITGGSPISGSLHLETGTSVAPLQTKPEGLVWCGRLCHFEAVSVARPSCVSANLRRSIIMRFLGAHACEIQVSVVWSSCTIEFLWICQVSRMHSPLIFRGTGHLCIVRIWSSSHPVCFVTQFAVCLKIRYTHGNVQGNIMMSIDERSLESPIFRLTHFGSYLNAISMLKRASCPGSCTLGASDEVSTWNERLLTKSTIGPPLVHHPGKSGQVFTSELLGVETPFLCFWSPGLREVCWTVGPRTWWEVWIPSAGVRSANQGRITKDWSNKVLAAVQVIFLKWPWQSGVSRKK